MNNCMVFISSYVYAKDQYITIVYYIIVLWTLYSYCTVIGGYVECRDCSQGPAQDSTGTTQDGSQTGAGDTINASMPSRYHRWLHTSFNI